MAEKTTRITCGTTVFSQRFIGLNFGYPEPELEARILNGETGIEEKTARSLVAIAKKVRALTELSLLESVSTRLLVDAAKLIRTGLPPRYAATVAIAEPLTDDPDALAAINPDEQPEPGTPAALELEADRREVRVLADAWEERAADALIAGYTSNDAVHRLLPVERIARDALLTRFELELSIRDLVVSTLRGHQLVSLPLESVDGLIDTPIRLRW